MKVKVNVTKEILSDSSECNFSPERNCMIAVAIIELFPDANVWNERANLLGYHSDCKFDRCLLPHIAIESIRIFDTSSPEQRLSITPFSFEIEVPEYVIEKIGLNQIYKVLSESKSLEHVN